jgi:hypothetical protein
MLDQVVSFDEFALICTYLVISVLSQIKFFLDFPDAALRTLCDGAAGTDEFLQFCDITDLVVTQASHFYTSINIDLVDAQTQLEHVQELFP